MNMKLLQTKQCKTCPWKKSAKVADIPNYSRDRHCNLINTIAHPGDISKINQPLKVMACHHSSENKEYECIGWLYNQLGSGNIILRMQMMRCSNVKEIDIDGEQKNTFDETFD
jgi:hypothetical protein